MLTYFLRKVKDDKLVEVYFGHFLKSLLLYDDVKN